MLDNFSLLPKEAFDAMGSVANNLIDKVSNAVGFVFVPRGAMKDKEEAVKFFIDEIKNNESMPPLAKAAAISKARKAIKEYINQNSVLEIAMDNMGEGADPNKVNDDWLVNFMDKAGKVSSEDVQLLLGKILAEECNNPESISRSLVNTLISMDKKSATAFRKICKYTITIYGDDGEVEPCAIIPDIIELDKYHTDIKFGEIVDLTSLGLIEYDGLAGYAIICENGERIISYADQKLLLKTSGGQIASGKVSLTRIGDELANIIMRDVDMEYFEKIKEYWKSNNVEILELD